MGPGSTTAAARRRPAGAAQRRGREPRLPRLVRPPRRPDLPLPALNGQRCAYVGARERAGQVEYDSSVLSAEGSGPSETQPGGRFAGRGNRRSDSRAAGGCRATTVDPRIAAVQITMRSRLLYRGPVTGIVDARTTSRDRDPPAAPRRHSRRDLRAANAGTSLPVRHARARHAPADDRLQGLRRRHCPRVACAFHGFPSRAVLEHVHRRTARAVCFGSSASRGSRQRPWQARSRPRRFAHRRPFRRSGSPGRSPPRSRAATACEGRSSTAESTSLPGWGRASAHPGAARSSTPGWRDGGWVNAVVVAAGDGVRSLVAHLPRVNIHVGERVRAGPGSSGSPEPPAPPPARTST